MATYGKRYRRAKKRYSRGLAKNQAKAVRAIANSVVTRRAESKEKISLYSSVSAYIGGGSVSFASVSYGTGTIVAGLTNNITQGAGDSQRIGDRIQVKKVEICFPVAGGDARNFLRFMLISNKAQCDKSSLASAVTQIMSNQSSSGTQYSAPVDNDTYTVHWDKMVRLQQADVAGVATNEIKLVKKTIVFPKGGFKAQWDLNLSEPNKELILLAISDSALAPNPGAIAGYVKVTFKDY